MEISVEAMLDAMNQAGLRLTKPRRALAAQVADWAHADQDFTADGLWHAVREHAPDVGRATVFRTVEVLAELGFLDRISFADGSERYHAIAPGTHHHHLTCEQCHRVVDVSACVAPDVLRQIALQAGFDLSGHRVEIFGRCPTCRDQA